MHLRLLKGPVSVKYRSYSTLQLNDCYLLSVSIEYFPIECFKARTKIAFKNVKNYDFTNFEGPDFPF